MQTIGTKSRPAITRDEGLGSEGLLCFEAINIFVILIVVIVSSVSKCQTLSSCTLLTCVIYCMSMYTFCERTVQFLKLRAGFFVVVFFSVFPVASHLYRMSHLIPGTFYWGRGIKHIHTRLPKILAFDLKLVFFHTFSFSTYLGTFALFSCLSDSGCRGGALVSKVTAD